VIDVIQRASPRRRLIGIDRADEILVGNDALAEIDVEMPSFWLIL